jgi:phosphomethylpyrimidine synthase
MILNGLKTDIDIGTNKPIVVNTSIGITQYSKKSFNLEIKKIQALSHLLQPPDIMMDLSLGGKNIYLYDYIHEIIGCPVGIIPIYKGIQKNGGISKSKLIDEMERAASANISWFTVHLTPNKELVRKALHRNIPFSSRSAIICINDMIVNNRDRSIYWEILDDIIKITKKNNIAISLGSAFRSADTESSLDETHLAEYDELVKIIEIFKKNNVKVMMEGIGHCSFKNFHVLISLLEKIDIPFMPLGPLFSNLFDNDDNIINAIGFFYSMTKSKNFKIINSITSKEHDGGILTVDEVVMGYKAARACARLCNEYLGYSSESGNNRCLNRTKCGCARCAMFCPTRYYIENKDRIKKWINTI